MFKTLLILSLLTVSTVFVSQAIARPGHRFDTTSNSCRDFSSGELEWDSRSWGVGGKTFQKVCKSCHHRDNDKGATFLWVESKTSKGWNRVFAQKKVKCANDGSWAAMTLSQQLKLNDYLFRFAFASADANDNI